MGRSNEMSVGDAITAFLKERGLKDQADVERVITEWPRIMGKGISENTEKIWFHSGTFYIKMAHPMWKNELSMAKSKIKELLNREIGSQAISEIRII